MIGMLHLGRLRESRMLIANVTAYRVSFPLPEQLQLKLGIGRAVKYDAVLVLVKVETDTGIVG